MKPSDLDKHADELLNEYDGAADKDEAPTLARGTQRRRACPSTITPCFWPICTITPGTT